MVYASYSNSVGVGAFWSSSRWRYFAVYANGRLIVQRGPIWLSDYEAHAETAGFLEATLQRGYLGTVTRWDWDSDVSEWRRA